MACHHGSNLTACHYRGMSHCRVLACDREATTAYAFWPVCGPHDDELQAGAEYRPQGSEQSALGMAAPMLLMGQQLLDLNEYIVVEPPDELAHDGDCPEGTLLPLRVRRRGDTETDITLVLPDDAIRNLAILLRKYDPGSGRGG